MAMIFGVKQLLDTRRANSHIRRYGSDGAMALKAGLDPERLFSQGRNIRFNRVVNAAGKRDGPRQFRVEALALSLCALDLYANSAGGIYDPSGEAKSARKPENRRPTADPLENTSQYEALPDSCPVIVPETSVRVIHAGLHPNRFHGAATTQRGLLSLRATISIIIAEGKARKKGIA